jgi:hypothetical protein
MAHAGTITSVAAAAAAVPGGRAARWPPCRMRDRHSTTEERKAVVLSLRAQAVQHLQAHGSSISTDELNRLNAAHAGCHWTQDVPITFVTDVGERFMLRSRGELPPASGSIKVLP